MITWIRTTTAFLTVAKWSVSPRSTRTETRCRMIATGARARPDLIDPDEDYTPTGCDICPLDFFNDLDRDGICGDQDPSPLDLLAHPVPSRFGLAVRPPGLQRQTQQSPAANPGRARASTLEPRHLRFSIHNPLNICPTCIQQVIVSFVNTTGGCLSVLPGDPPASVGVRCVLFLDCSSDVGNVLTSRQIRIGNSTVPDSDLTGSPNPWAFVVPFASLKHVGASALSRSAAGKFRPTDPAG